MQCSALRLATLVKQFFKMPLLRCAVVVVAVVTRSLPRDGAMAEDHGAPETGRLPKTWTRSG